jgi:hypothetical protein
MLAEGGGKRALISQFYRTQAARDSRKRLETNR